jgi:PKD repeat protein
MKNHLLFLFLFLTGVAVQKGQAQQCNADFTFTVDSGQVVFTNTSTGPPAGFGSFWYFGDGQNDFGQNVTHQYTSTGTYYATLYIQSNDSTCFDSIVKPVQITVVNAANSCNAQFYYSQSATNGQLLNFHSIYNDTSSLQYSWSFGDGSGSSLPYPSHMYATAGNYQACLSVYNPTTSCSDTFCYTVNAAYYQHCEPHIYYSTTPGVTGLVNFSTDTVVWTRNYFWDFGDGTTSTLQSPVHQFNNGYYQISLTIFDSLCTDSTYIYLGFGLPQPTCNADFTLVADSVDPSQFWITNNSYGSHFMWNFGDGTIDSTNFYPTHTYPDTGTYTICIAVWDTSTNCSESFCLSLYTGRSTGTVTVTVIPGVVGIKEPAFKDLKLYPNPASDHITVEAPSASSIIIRDITGRTVVTKELNEVKSEIDVSTLSRGTYFMILNMNGMITQKKFIKQ